MKHHKVFYFNCYNCRRRKRVSEEAKARPGMCQVCYDRESAKQDREEEHPKQ